jgi:hypothetical protein
MRERNEDVYVTHETKMIIHTFYFILTPLYPFTKKK